MFYLITSILQKLKTKMKKAINDSYLTRLRCKKAMNDELAAVHAGVNQISKKKNIYFLRRNIHRIEKGLTINRTFRPFAIKYAADTINTFISLDSDNLICEKERQYFSQILFHYFEVMSGRNEVIEIKDRFLKYLEIANLFSLERKVSRPKPSILPTYEDFFSLCASRHSVRSFENKQIDRHIFERAFEAAVLAPSACNRQPIRYIVIEGTKIDAFKPLLGGAQTFIENVPYLLIIVGDLSAFDQPSDRHLIYIDGGLSAMVMLLALESQGVGTCMVSWPDISKNNLQISQILKLRREERIVACILAGYPDKTHANALSIRKSIDELRIYYDS